MNPRKPDVVELAHISFPLVIGAYDWSVRKPKIMFGFGFAQAVFEFSAQHDDSDSQLGANQRKTKVNLG